LVVVAPAPVFVVFLGGERVEGHTTVGADRLFPAGRFEDGFSNRYGHTVLHALYW
jgi:hypothetical protein